MRPMPDQWTKLIRFEQGIPSTYKIYTDHIQAFLDRELIKSCPNNGGPFWVGETFCGLLIVKAVTYMAKKG